MKKHNLLYIFPDQFRLMSLGLWQNPEFATLIPGRGDPVFTPNLDQLANQSTILTNAVSNCPVCSPHRGSLMTGNFPSRSGVPLNCHSQRMTSELPDDAPCFTDALAQAGYHVGYIGKWHLDVPTPNDPENPGEFVDSRTPAWDSYTEPQRRHGIHYWYGYGTFDEHNNPHYYDTHGKRHDPKTWSAEHEADKAIEYLTNQNGERDQDKPFALFLSMNPPHSPYSGLEDCRESDWQLYKDKTHAELLVRDNASHDMDKSDAAAYYFANVSGVDKEIGRIIDTLKTMGEWENTLVVFTSDHGETLCSHAISDAKNCIYNEAFSVPFLIKRPGQKVHFHSPAFVNSADIMPTTLGLLSLREYTPAPIHGRDLSQIVNQPQPEFQSALYLRNLDGERNSQGEVVDYFPQSRGIKTEHYTLAIDINTSHQITSTLLFDNQSDPYQFNNLPFEPDAPYVRHLLREMAKELVRVQDPWAEKGILANLLPYHLFDN
ncbi:arylsulfatase [Vibrio albus]|uniref:Arylsulfatase n=1 Tax=Vibrio albus TaxID=2200953 RepID=A0A2U3B5J2_9VIBR|nr:sulfatase [Vibrio albus]PWI32047.1 arylsulfatase [Vibrio albus]